MAQRQRSKIMSFLGENKLLLGVVGIGVAVCGAVGYKYYVCPSPRQAALDHTEKRRIVSPEKVICQLLQLIEAKKVLEIGVYTGYSILSTAMSLPPDGKVLVWEITDNFLNEVQGQHSFKEAGSESKIGSRLHSVITTLDDLIAGGEADFDLVFIDASRASRDQCYEKALQLIRKGGLIITGSV